MLDQFVASKNTKHQSKTRNQPELKNFPELKYVFMCFQGKRTSNRNLPIIWNHLTQKIDRFGGLNLPQCQPFLSMPDSGNPLFLLHQKRTKKEKKSLVPKYFFLTIIGTN